MRFRLCAPVLGVLLAGLPALAEDVPTSPVAEDVQQAPEEPPGVDEPDAPIAPADVVPPAVVPEATTVPDAATTPGQNAAAAPETRVEDPLNGGAALFAALGAVVGLATGVGIDVLGIYLLVSNPQLLAAVGLAGGIGAVLVLATAAFAGGGAGVGAWIGGADGAGIAFASIGALVGASVGTGGGRSSATSSACSARWLSPAGSRPWSGR